MKAYGYEVEGSTAVLQDITEVIKSKNMRLNWGKFNTGDFYWTGNGERYKVEINHDTKKVMLIEE